LKVVPNKVLQFVDLSATVFLGIEGAMAAIDGNLDRPWITKQSRSSPFCLVR
jgi:hypothetical protein